MLTAQAATGAGAAAIAIPAAIIPRRVISPTCRPRGKSAAWMNLRELSTAPEF